MVDSPEIPSGLKSNAKVIQYELREGDDNYKLIELSHRHRTALIASCTYLRWMSRHASLPSDLITNDMLDAWVSDLELRLMTDIDFCARMIECIENDDDVKQALFDFMQSQFGIKPFDEPLTEEQLTENLAGTSNPTCDEDILFSQCREVVRTTHLAVMDVFQKIEVTSNVSELMQAMVTSVPFVAGVVKALGGEGLADIIQYYQNSILEGYEGQFTETPGGTFDELSYFLWCSCKVDCNITVARIRKFYHDRLAVYMSPPSAEGLINFLEQIAGINQDTTFVVDLAHYVAWHLVDISGFLFGNSFDSATLKYIITKMADEPSDDHIAIALLLGDCPNCEITNTIIEGTEIIP